MHDRPTAVTVFGVINLILAILGVLGIAWMVIRTMELLPLPENPNDPTAALMENNVGYYWFTQISMWLGAAMTILLLAAAIGMFKLHAWARNAAILWCVYTIVMTILASAINAVLLMLPMLDSSDPAEQVGGRFGLVFMAVFALLYVGYCVIQIIYLTRPRIVAAFTQPDAEPWGL